LSAEAQRGLDARELDRPALEGSDEMSPNPYGAGRLGAVLLAAVLLGACGAGATQSPATTPAPTASPAAVADEALVADLAAAWSDSYDAAKVAALYAPDAAVHELTNVNLTSTGLEAIQARVKSLNAMDFKVVVTSAPIRQDEFVAVFSKYGEVEATWPGLVVYQLKDGKVLEQWVYEEGPPTDASPPPAAAADEALVADLAAVMSNPYDAARVAALYAPDAVIHETTANMTQTGLDEIGARIRDFNASNFEAVVTSAPIRQNNFVAAFHTYAGGDVSDGRALVVYELKDGLVLNQWIYPAQ
jgi:hypothetical protein